MQWSIQKNNLSTRDLVVFSMLGAIMFAAKKGMEGLPNVHLTALFIVSFTLVYRIRALIPLYVYILLDGAVSGFAMWWLPYLYVWLPLWGIVMLLSKIKALRSPKAGTPVYMAVCAFHGLSFGTLYAPMQAFMFGLDFNGMVSWIAAGLPFDIVHGVSNFCIGALIFPLYKLLQKLK